MMTVYNTVCVTVGLFLVLAFSCAYAKLYEGKSSHHACILLDLDFRLEVTASKDGSVVSSRTWTPEHSVKPEASCYDSHRSLSLTFTGPNHTFTGPLLSFRFRIDNTKVFLKRTVQFVPTEIFPELVRPSKFTMKFEDPLDLNLGDIDTSYLCFTRESTSYIDVSKYHHSYTYAVNVDITYMKVQAYFVRDSKFSDAVECEAENIPRERNTAQIIVGAVFLGVLMLGVVASLLLNVLCRRYQKQQI